MNTTNTFNNDITFGRKVALFTFLVATFLIFIFYITEFKGTIYFVFLYFFSALGFNIYIFLKLSYIYFKELNNRKTILVTLFILLLNIPVGFFYTDLGFKIYNSIMSN